MVVAAMSLRYDISVKGSIQKDGPRVRSKGKACVQGKKEFGSYYMSEYAQIQQK
jgi:hypothetical protein